jgi:hypothetical protein
MHANPNELPPEAAQAAVLGLLTDAEVQRPVVAGRAGA